MREQDVEIGPGSKMRLATVIALCTIIGGPLVALLVKVERVDARLERIESHIFVDWNAGHMVIWTARFADLNRTNGIIVPDPEPIRKSFGP
jgi:hypothetical protein